MLGSDYASDCVALFDAHQRCGSVTATAISMGYSLDVDRDTHDPEESVSVNVNHMTWISTANAETVSKGDPEHFYYEARGSAIFVCIGLPERPTAQIADMECWRLTHKVYGLHLRTPPPGR